MVIIFIIFRQIVTFALVASFSVFFMTLFVVVGLWTTKIQRNVVERADEVKNIGGYLMVSLGGLIAGGISLVALVFI
ncbi:MAG: hypothetical protein HYT62_02925 [Candidatus Yanofskybacteria bacterium]|nr:hypothetical protein [Candidatus Yanofskybacteria bacterium]